MCLVVDIDRTNKLKNESKNKITVYKVVLPNNTTPWIGASVNAGYFVAEGQLRPIIPNQSIFDGAIHVYLSKAVVGHWDTKQRVLKCWAWKKDLIAVDATKIPIRVGDRATMIGRDGGDMVSARDMAQKIETSHYEIITRLNPLMERVIS